MKKIILAMLICGVFLFGITGCGSESNLKETENDLQETQDKYGWVEKETVNTLVAKFNTEVVDNSTLNPAASDYLTETNNQYWYGLVEGMYLVVVPENYTGDKTVDIVDSMILFVEKSSQYETDSMEYTKYLIKANSDKITDTEIDSLIEDAKANSTSGKTANNGKGISIGYLDEDEACQYQVIRLYK